MSLDLKTFCYLGKLSLEVERIKPNGEYFKVTETTLLFPKQPVTKSSKMMKIQTHISSML